MGRMESCRDLHIGLWKILSRSKGKGKEEISQIFIVANLLYYRKTNLT